MIAKVVFVQGVGIKRITRKDLDRYEKEYLDYANRLWQGVFLSKLPIPEMDAVYKSMLSPFQYWLIERLQIERIEEKEDKKE